MKSNIITSPIVLTSARLEAIADRFVFIPMETSLASVRILRILQQNGSMNPKKIMEFSGGTKSNVSQRLKYLEEKGHVTRKYASVPNDKRRVLVEITKDGIKHLDFIDRRLKKAQMKLIGYFSQEEIDQHLAFFEKINSIIDMQEKNLTKIFKQ